MSNPFQPTTPVPPHALTPNPFEAPARNPFRRALVVPPQTPAPNPFQAPTPNPFDDLPAEYTNPFEDPVELRNPFEEQEASPAAEMVARVPEMEGMVLDPQPEGREGPQVTESEASLNQPEGTGLEY